MADKEKDTAQQVFERWSTDKSKTNMSALLTALTPDVRAAMSRHGVQGDPNIFNSARVHLAKQMDNYDPTKANIKTFTYRTLQRLPRIAARQKNVVHVPESSDTDNRRLRAERENLIDILDREPTVEELADRTGVSVDRILTLRNRFSRPIMAASQLENVQGGGFGFPASLRTADQELWRSIVIKALDPVDKKIYEWSTRRNPLPKNEMAARLGMSASAVTQRADKIDKRFKEYGG